MAKRLLLSCFIIFSSFISLANCQPDTKINFVMPANENEKSLCEKSDGTWEMMHNGCGDSCFFNENPGVRCSMAFKAACNCGPKRCFDNKQKTCRKIKETNKNTKRIY